MKRLAVFAALAVFAGSSALAGALTFTPRPNPSQKLGLAGGKPALQSDGRSVSAVLVLQSGTVEAEAAPAFLLGVHNATALPAALTAKALKVTADGAEVHLISAEQLRKAAQDRLDIAQSQLHARTTTRSPSQSSAMAYVRTRDGRYLVDDQPQFGSNKQLAAEAQARVDEAKAALASADAMGFKPSTIAAGDIVWTPLMLAPLPKKTTSLELALTVAGETHTFVYAIASD